MSEKKPTRTVTTQDLIDYAALLNGQGFSKFYGWQWYVGSNETPEGTRHFLARRDVAPTSNGRAPQGEFAGIRHNVQTEKGPML